MKSVTLFTKFPFSKLPFTLPNYPAGIFTVKSSTHSCINSSLTTNMCWMLRYTSLHSEVLFEVQEVVDVILKCSQGTCKTFSFSSKQRLLEKVT